MPLLSLLIALLMALPSMAAWVPASSELAAIDWCEEATNDADDTKQAAAAATDRCAAEDDSDDEPDGDGLEPASHPTADMRPRPVSFACDAAAKRDGICTRVLRPPSST